jgi:putative heme iron utilization protein
VSRHGGANWHVTGIDARGVDLATGDETARLRFENAVSTAQELRRALSDLAEAARAGN